MVLHYIIVTRTTHLQRVPREAPLRSGRHGMGCFPESLLMMMVMMMMTAGICMYIPYNNWCYSEETYYHT